MNPAISSNPIKKTVRFGDFNKPDFIDTNSIDTY